MRSLGRAVLAGLLGIGFLALPAGAESSRLLDRSYLEDLLKEPSERIDLSGTLLEITRRSAGDLTGRTVSVDSLQRTLDDMAGQVSDSLDGASGAGEISGAIRRVLFERQDFKVDRSRLFESSLDALLLNDVLTRRRGQCLSLSLVYLILAEELNLPLRGVVVPGHFFVRLQDQENPVNIETTDGGRLRDDAYYRRRFMRGYSDPVSLRSLDKKEVIGVYLSNLATHYKLRGAEEHAIFIFETVDRILPQWPSLYVNIGNAHERLGRIAKAGLFYQKALNINPALCEAHYNLGLIYFMYLPRPRAARQHGRIAQRLGCRLHPRFRQFIK